jgi:hypothetical protein
MIVIFFSFIFPRSSGRYDPTQVASERTDDGYFPAIKESEHDIARFTFSVGPVNNCRSIKDEAHLVEVDSAFANGPIAFGWVPAKVANPREQFRKFFRHAVCSNAGPMR